MSSFKLKLVGYFVLLALVPLTVAVLGYTAVARQSETRLADGRLQAGLRSALTAYQDEVLAAGRAATRLAHDPELQHALQTGNLQVLRRVDLESPTLHVSLGRSRVEPGEPGLERTVDVVRGGRLLGQVMVTVPLDRLLLSHVRSRSGLAAEDELVLVARGRVFGGPESLIGGPLGQAAGRTGSVEIGGVRWRALVAAPLHEPAGVSFAVLAPQRLIDAASGSNLRRLLLAALASLALIAAVAYLLGRTIVHTLGELVRGARAIASGRLGERVPVHGADEFASLAGAFNEMAGQLEARVEELAAARARLRDATTRLGAALAATHDVAELRRVVVETAVEATGAAGGVLRDDGGPIVRIGDPTARAERIELPLEAGGKSFGVLILSADAFDDEARAAAASLAAQAVVALENARLHGIVEQQALVDGLTGLANRRCAEQALHVEISRAARFGGPLGLVLADLDGFKALNDAYGHAFGDDVLREFAAGLRASVREVDHASRWGGEEFMLLLPATDLSGATGVAERVRAALEARTILGPNGASVAVTASLGVATFPEHGSPEALFRAADAALYEAKRTGKNRVVAAGEPARRP